jgi:hypothetical protein
LGDDSEDDDSEDDDSEDDNSEDDDSEDDDSEDDNSEADNSEADEPPPATPVPKPEPSVTLCGRCERFNLGALLSKESEEQSMGFLSSFANADCPFCRLVAEAIRRSWGGWDLARVCAHAKTPPTVFIHSRSPLSVKRQGRITHPQPRLLLAVDQQPENFQRNRPSLREVDRIVNRFVITEVEALPPSAPEGPGVGSDEWLLPRRHVGERVDPELIKSWLAQCRRHHKHSLKKSGGGGGGGGGRSSALFHPDFPFRLIDVVGECLVQKAEPCNYVALSYVWGLTPTVLEPGDDESVVPILLSTRANIKDLGTPGSLSESRQTTRATGRNPRTILDAIKLARQIGMRYLWADTLCIMQDDDSDRGRLVGLMDDIYDNATLTFIAAAGSDSDAGLRGVSHRAGRPIGRTKMTDAMNQQSFDLSLGLPSLCEEVRRSHWNTRGWTFQEQGLSQRCVYFTPDEMFFNCTEAQWREGYDYGEQQQAAAGGRREPTTIQIRTGPPVWNRNIRKDPDPTPYRYLGGRGEKLDVMSYQRTVQDYSRRSLKYNGDVLAAFEGVFKRYKRAGGRDDMTTRQTQGIPVQALHQAILWFPSPSSRRRVCVPSESVPVPPRFSTWSWYVMLPPPPPPHIPTRAALSDLTPVCLAC